MKTFDRFKFKCAACQAEYSIITRVFIGFYSCPKCGSGNTPIGSETIIDELP